MSQEFALRAFQVHFTMFRDGEPPEAMTPVAKHMYDTNPSLATMTAEQRKAWQEKLKKIFYRE
jgi:hypothetical protein